MYRDTQTHTHTEHASYTHPDTQQSQTPELHRDTRTHTQKHNIDTQAHILHTTHTLYTQRHRHTPHAACTLLLHTHNAHTDTRTHGRACWDRSLPWAAAFRVHARCVYTASLLPVYAWAARSGEHGLCVLPSPARTVLGSPAHCDWVSGWPSDADAAVRPCAHAGHTCGSV